MKQIYAWDNNSHPTVDKSEIQKVKFTYPIEGLPSMTLFGSWNGWKVGSEMIFCPKSNMFWA